ncbi:MAG: FadR family transcriptional regulator [Acidobacteria bacterium]|nr:FadR family transcriptional regulator [Acidobacteriota bacterium]
MLQENLRSAREALDPGLLAALQPIPRVDLTGEVVRRFKALLAHGKIKPGGRLPPERELAGLLGISRPSLRHGLKALEIIGAIEARRRHGTFVSSSAGKILEEPLQFAVLLDSISFEDLYEVRRTVEVELAALAAERASQPELAAIDQCLAQQRAGMESPGEFLQKDLEFHHLIARASHNQLFGVFLGSLRRQMSDKMQLLLGAPGPDFKANLAATIAEHGRILGSLRDRNPERARDAMRQHLERVYAQWASLAPAPAAG